MRRIKTLVIYLTFFVVACEDSESSSQSNNQCYEFYDVVLLNGYVRDSIFKNCKGQDRFYYKVYNREGKIEGEYYKVNGQYEDTFKVYSRDRVVKVRIYNQGKIVTEFEQ